MSQYVDGILGPLIIHDPEDPYLNQYEQEYTVIISDWYHTESRILLNGYLNPNNSFGHKVTLNVIPLFIIKIRNE